MVLNMNMFFKGLNSLRPSTASSGYHFNPGIVVGFNYRVLEGTITWMKSIGIGINTIGALVLILFGQKPNAPNILWVISFHH